MRRLLRLTSLGVLLAAVGIVGCGRQAQVASGLAPNEIDVNGTVYQVSGPYAHDNMAVYLIQCASPVQDDKDYLTLDQGLKDGVVKVSEKEQEQVRELQIENLSDQPLFLQEGDRITGGKQDRTLFSSLVIPPKSGKMAIPTFCIEQSRWREGATGRAFACTSNAALAPKEVREAAKVSKDQGEVWRAVEQKKGQAAQSLATPNTNTSLNESLDNEKVKKLGDECATALQGPLERNPKAVGVAIVVNGKIEEVNIYPNNRLLGKLYPRIIQSYAFQAALEKDKAKDAPKVETKDVVQFMTAGKERETVRDEQVNGDNRLNVFYCDKDRSCAETSYQGKPAHTQFLSRSEFSNQPAAARPANPGDNQQNRQQLSQPALPNQAPGGQAPSLPQGGNPPAPQPPIPPQP